MSDLNISMILRLVDRVTAPARPVLDTMRQVRNAIGDSGNAAIAAGQRIDRAVSGQVQAVQRSALGLAGMGASLAASLKPAIDFERSMAGVKKVISFEEETGIAALSRDILDLSGRLPFAAEGLTDIIAAAGRAGLINAALPDDQKRAELIEFAEAAATMGTAFDISAEAAGNAMAQWRQTLKMTTDETTVYADALNYLANNMNTTEADLVEMTQRVGSLGELAGLTNLDFLALAASISAAGAAPEVASTSLKNLTNALTRGESATKRQVQIFNQLGIDAGEMAERMQVDAKGAILDVLEALQQLPAAQQNAALGDLFGEEGKSAIGSLLTNLDGLRAAFERVGDPAQFTGAMMAEFEAQAGTTAASLRLTMNDLTALSITLGTVFLPAVRDALGMLRDFLGPISEWAQANPEMVSQIGKLVIGLAAFRLAIFAARLAFIGVFGPAGAILKGLGLVLKAARLFNPFGLMIAAVAGLATLIYRHWDEITAYLREKWAAIVAGFDEGWLQGMWAIVREFNPTTLIMDAISGLAGVVLAEVNTLARSIADALGMIDLYDAGVAMIRSMWDGAQSLVVQMVSAISAKLHDIVPNWMLRAWNWVSGDDAQLPEVSNQAPLQAPGAAPPTTINNVTAEVHTAPGDDAAAIAQKSSAAITAALSNNRSSQPLHDGPDYNAF